jgi:hypothetical protein
LGVNVDFSSPPQSSGYLRRSAVVCGRRKAE